MSRNVLAELFRVDVRTIKNLVDEGMPKEARGMYSLRACVPWYLEREREAARKGKGPSDLDLAKQRKTLADARMAELAVAEAEATLLPAELLEERFGAVCDRLRAKCTQLPSRFSSKIQQAQTAGESIAVGEDMRDYVLRAFQEVADELEAEDAGDDDATGVAA